MITRERAEKASSYGFWTSYAVETAARQTLRQLEPKIQQQRKDLNLNSTEGEAILKRNALKANIAQASRLLVTQKAASIVNVISLLAMLGTDAFPISAENRPKKIFCEKNPDYSPSPVAGQNPSIGQSKVICRAVNIDAQRKPIENITPYEPEVAYRSEYNRPERSERSGREDRPHLSSSAAVER